MHRKHHDLLIAIAIATINVLWAVFPTHIPLIGVLLALPLVFVVPGYTLTEILFYKRPLTGAERLLFSSGLSLAIAVVSGLILNLFPGGIQALSWALWLGLLTVLFSLVAAYLRKDRGIEASPVRAHIAPYPWLIFLVAILVAISSIVYSIIGVLQQPYPGFTQLWMLPKTGGENCALRLGVHSFESTSVAYRITMIVMENKVTSWSPVVLAPEQEWNQLVPIPPQTTHNVSVEVQLYRLDKPLAIYREAHAVLDNCASAGSTPRVHRMPTSPPSAAGGSASAASS